jgi:hypothetical protein
MLIILNINNETCVSLKSVTNTAFIYLRNLAGTDYKLHEEDAIALKYLGAVKKE